jgi:hypothetical protein
VFNLTQQTPFVRRLIGLVVAASVAAGTAGEQRQRDVAVEPLVVGEVDLLGGAAPERAQDAVTAPRTGLGPPPSRYPASRPEGLPRSRARPVYAA